MSPDTSKADARERWALILGGSSGMGEATARRLAAAGYNICGIHLDFRAGLAHVEELKADLEKAGAEVLYVNMNAADDEKRAGALAELGARFEAARKAGRDPFVQVVMHSLAFGSLVPFIAEDPKAAVDRKKMEMTQDVMANSLVYWVQDLYRAGFLGKGSRVFAMTSEGSTRVVPSYGVVSSAKAALESHVRQLAMELARNRSGVTVNAIRAGVTDTPALRKIPEAQAMIDITLRRNPTGRMTTPEDVANAILALSGEGTEFINGDIISVDGGEFITGA
jgi:enoyl-[acyl-carrier protein] reductase III